MKTINQFMLALFVALAVSCSKDDEDNEVSVLPVTMEFVTDMSFPELSAAQEIQISFSKPAAVAGTIRIGLDPADASGFTTTPAVVDGEIQLQIEKGATGASFTFDPENNDELHGNREFNFVLFEDNEHFLVGSKSSMEITIFEDEVPAATNFAWVKHQVLEDQTEGLELPIQFSVPVPGAAVVRVKVEGEAVGDFLATVPPMDANNIIELSVASGVWDVKIGLQPKNNSSLDQHRELKFRIVEVSGPVNMGDRLELQLLLKDDELAGKVHSIETTDPDGKILRSIEYNSQGRIHKVHTEENASGNVLTQIYEYDASGKLISIGGGDFEAFTWENGKIIRSEKFVGFFGTQQSLYEYQNGMLIRRRNFTLDNNRNATESERYTYTYDANGNIQTELHTSLINGAWTEVSTRSFGSYSQVPDPSALEAIPFLFSQQQLYMTLSVKNNSSIDNLYYLHTFDTAGKLTERKRNDNRENIKYSYY